jgi:hypothetical protein
MRRWRRWATALAADDGSASLEFISAGVLLLVPLVYLVLAMSSVQGGALAVEGAARQAARVYVQASSESEAQARAESAVRFALADYGLDASEATVRIRCSRDPGDCLTRRGIVTVTVGVRVRLPLVPRGLSVSTAASVPLAATAAQQVSRFSSAE